MWIKLSVQQLIKNSVHVGHDVRITLMSNSWFFKGRRQNIFIIDVLSTLNIFRLVFFFFHKIIYKRGYILYVNNLNVMADLVELWAKKSTQPFSNLKWYVGALTNVKNLFSLFEYIKLAKRKEKKHMYNTYGLIRMRRIPNALFLSSLGVSVNAKIEGMSLKLPTVGIIDTNISSFGITIPIPGNDQSIDALNFYHSYLSKTIILGKYNCLLKFKHIILNENLSNKLLEEDENWWMSRFKLDKIKSHNWRYIKSQERWWKWKKSKLFSKRVAAVYKFNLSEKLRKKLLRRILEWKFLKRRLKGNLEPNGFFFKVKNLMDRRFKFENNFISNNKEDLDGLLEFSAFKNMLANSLRRFREFKLGSGKDRRRLFNIYIKFFTKLKFKQIENKNIYRKHNRIVFYKYNEVNFIDESTLN